MRCAVAALCALWCLATACAGPVTALRAANGDTSGAEDVSECQRCADGGECSLAFRGRPGQFCGSWLDRAGTRRPCCCPVDATCQVSTYDCRCSASAYPNGARPSANRFGWVWWLLGAILLCVCCGPCCVFAFQSLRRRRELSQIPEAIPVDGSTPYYSGNPVAGLPAVAPQAYPGGYGSAGRVGGMGAGAGAALGGTAGLVGGLLLGEALADAGPHYGDGGFGGGDDGGGGGGDFSGDF